MKKLLLAVTAIAVFAVTPAVKASTITTGLWQYNFTGFDGETGWILLAGTVNSANPNEVYNITGGEIDITSGGDIVAGIGGNAFPTGIFTLSPPPDSSTAFYATGNLNLYFGSQDFLDVFQRNAGIPSLTDENIQNSNNQLTDVQLPPFYAPEPSSLVLLGSGLLGAAFLLFRRNRSARSATTA